jgi:hypothetical protein
MHQVNPLDYQTPLVFKLSFGGKSGKNVEIKPSDYWSQEEWLSLSKDDVENFIVNDFWSNILESTEGIIYFNISVEDTIATLSITIGYETEEIEIDALKFIDLDEWNSYDNDEKIDLIQSNMNEESYLIYEMIDICLI